MADGGESRDLHDKACAERECDPASATGWDARTVTADDVVQWVRAKPADGPAVAVVRCTRVTGDIDLRWSNLERPVRFERCRIEGDILLVDAKVPELAVVGSVVESEINLTRLDVSGCVTISHSVCSGLLVTGAKIGGDLHCQHSELYARCAGGPALDGRGIDVKGDLTLSPAVRAHAEVSLRAAKVGRDLRFDGSHFADNLRPAIDASGIVVTGGVCFGVAFDDDGRAVCDPCGEPLRCKADGEVRLVAATIGGALDCNGARFTHPGGAAFNGDGIQRVGGDLQLGVSTDAEDTAVRDSRGQPIRFEADGEVRLIGAAIQGQLLALGGSFRAQGGDALSLDGASAADIGLEVARDSAGTVLDASGSALRFHAVGAVRLLGVRVVGQVRCRGARLENGSGVALNFSGAEVGEQVFLGQYEPTGAMPIPFEATGEVRMRSADLGALRCKGASFSNDKDALGASRLKTNHFQWRKVDVNGTVDLRDASIGVLDDDIAGWSGPVRIGGLTYSLAGPAAEDENAEELTVDERTLWLKKQERYLSQPYRYLAAVYRARGDDRWSRKIAMEQFNEQVRRKDGGLKQRTKWWRRVLRYTIGHGYEPWRAIYWALGLWLVGVAWVLLALHADVMVPTKSALATGTTTTTVAGAPATTPTTLNPRDCKSQSYPCLSPLTYSAELVFPIVKLDQRDNWRPSGPLKYRLMIPVLVAFGWALTTLVVAGFTSLVRRE